MPTRRNVNWLAILAARSILLVIAALASNTANASTYPANIIRLIVPAAPATPPDIISRIVANEIRSDKGWNIVVENRPGASMTIAAKAALSQPADGYTVLAMSLPIASAPSLLPHAGFDLMKDFMPVIKVSTSYNVLVVPPSLPVNSVSDLIAYLKKHPDQIFASGGFGTPAHLIGERFKLQQHVQATHVPYQIPQAIGSLLNAQSQFMFITTLPVVDLIHTGKLRALAVTGPHRSTALKDVSTVVEQGYPNLVISDWVGFCVKTGTPNEIVEALNKAINEALARPKVRETITKLGAEPAGGTPEEFGNLIKSEIAHWSKVIKESNIKIHQ